MLTTTVTHLECLHGAITARLHIIPLRLCSLVSGQGDRVESRSGQFYIQVLVAVLLCLKLLHFPKHQISLHKMATIMLSLLVSQ